jgi:hypothetical protein
MKKTDPAGMVSADSKSTTFATRVARTMWETPARTVANAHGLLPRHVLECATPGDWSSVQELTKKLVKQAVSNIAITLAHMEIEHA